MSTYTQILYHIVFSTRNRDKVLNKEHRVRLFKDIWGILKKKNCHLYRINGVEDHLHIVTHLHPQISLSSLIKDIKLGSSSFIKENKIFPQFQSWQDGYGAFTYSIKEKDNLIEYVKNQEQHHKATSYKEEYIQLLNENNIRFDEKFLI